MSKKTRTSKIKATEEIQKRSQGGDSDYATKGTMKTRPPLRAIRVDDQLLKAAKDYKKANGTSFYTLGYEAVRERLVREGFLKESSESKN